MVGSLFEDLSRVTVGDRKGSYQNGWIHNLKSWIMKRLK